MDSKREGEIAIKIVDYLMRRHREAWYSKNLPEEIADYARETGIPLPDMNEFLMPRILAVIEDWLKQSDKRALVNQGSDVA